MHINLKLGSLHPLRTNNEKELSGIMVCEKDFGKQGREVAKAKGIGR